MKVSYHERNTNLLLFGHRFRSDDRNANGQLRYMCPKFYLFLDYNHGKFHHSKCNLEKPRTAFAIAFVLLFFLALSDLLVGLICQPSFVAFKIAELRRDFSCYCISRMIQSISGWTTSGVSLLTLSAVSLDRLLSLTLHLRYNTIVTVPRAFVACVFLWFFAVTVMMLRFTMTNWIILPLIILLTTFLVTALSTLKIFMIVRKHLCQIKQLQRNLNTSQTETAQVLKCRKSAVTVLYVYGLFWIFYVPFCVTMLMVQPRDTR